MPSDFDELEALVTADARQIYSETVIDHAMNPRNVGTIPDADGFGHVKGPCGDTMAIWLRIKEGRITNASFSTDGCGTSIASGSMVTELAKGKMILEAQSINQENVLDALDGLPEESAHCALLAATTLKQALRDYLAIQREPWKKAYRGR